MGRAIRVTGTAGLAALACLAAVACDGKPAPAPAPAPPARPAAGALAARPARRAGPADAAVDDSEVVAAVAESARTGAPLPARYAKLPPRVSPVRVAVRSVHDHLLATPGAVADWDALVAALGRFAETQRTTVDAGALAPLVEEWSDWDAEDRDAEMRLATRYVRALGILHAQGEIDAAQLATVFADLPDAPSMSAAGACVQGANVARLAVTTPGEDVPKALGDALESARKAFREIGWPGGIARFLEIAATRLERGGKATLRSHWLRDNAGAAYRESADPLNEALVVQVRAEAARDQGDVERALKLAAQSAEKIRATGTRGRELADSLYLVAQLAVARGLFPEALVALDGLVAEIEYGQLPRAQLVIAQSQRATMLRLLGRYDDALAAVAAGIAADGEDARPADPRRARLRAELDEIAGATLVDAGRFADAAQRFHAAATGHERIGAGDPRAGVARLAAADALARAGRGGEARAIVDAVLGAPKVQVALRAQCAVVLRTLRDFDAAERELTLAETEGGPAVREQLEEERARLAADRGDFDEARPLFASATARMEKELSRYGAQRTAVVLLDWAAGEERAGDVPEAARIADRAIGLLADVPASQELDRARAFWTRLMRRRLDFASSMRVAATRVETLPVGSPARLDAAIDVYLARIEMAARGEAKARAALDEVLEPVAHERIRALVPELSMPPVPAGGAAPRPSARLTLLESAARVQGGSAEALLAFAANLPQDEPELRRWALRRVTVRPAEELKGVDWVTFLDRWHGAPPTNSAAVRSALREGERLLAVESLGAKSVVVDVGAGSVMHQLVEGDLGLRAFWEAVVVDPSPDKLSAAARSVVRSSERIRVALSGGNEGRVYLSLAPSFGALPGDLLVLPTHAADRELIETRDVVFVTSPSEMVAAAARPAPPSPPYLRDPFAPLTARHAIVELRPVDDATRARFLGLVDEARGRGLELLAAVRDAKLRLRSEWKVDPARPRVPPWALFALRGAP